MPNANSAFPAALFAELKLQVPVIVALTFKVLLLAALALVTSKDNPARRTVRTIRFLVGFNSIYSL